MRDKKGRFVKKMPLFQVGQIVFDGHASYELIYKIEPHDRDFRYFCYKYRRNFHFKGGKFYAANLLDVYDHCSTYFENREISKRTKVTDYFITLLCAEADAHRRRMELIKELRLCQKELDSLYMTLNKSCYQFERRAEEAKFERVVLKSGELDSPYLRDVGYLKKWANEN